MSEFVMSESVAEATDAALALVQRTSLTRLVADAVENLILTGALPPGSKLNEATVADRFGVSRGPMREAFRMLECSRRMDTDPGCRLNIDPGSVAAH